MDKGQTKIIFFQFWKLKAQAGALASAEGLLSAASPGGRQRGRETRPPPGPFRRADPTREEGARHPSRHVKALPLQTVTLEPPNVGGDTVKSQKR